MFHIFISLYSFTQNKLNGVNENHLVIQLRCNEENKDEFHFKIIISFLFLFCVKIKYFFFFDMSKFVKSLVYA